MDKATRQRRQEETSRKILDAHEAKMHEGSLRQEKERSDYEGNLIEGTARHLHDNMDRADRQELESQLEHYARHGRT